MNKKIAIKNFRVFKDYSDFELKPITILTGTNSSGKSSFIKALKLIQNNISTSTPDASNFNKLEFNIQDTYSLGGFSKINSIYSDEKDIYFKISYSNDLFGELYSEIVYEPNNSYRKDEGVIKKHTIYKDGKILIEIKYDEEECLLKKSFDNKDIWVRVFFELLKETKHFRDVIKIIRTIRSGGELSNEENLIVEELGKKGFIYDLPDHGQMGSFYNNKNENYINTTAYILTNSLRTEKVFFQFDFYDKIESYKIKNFKNINYSLIDEKDKESVYHLTSELLDNGISTIDELEIIINEITKNYINNDLLVNSKVQLHPDLDYTRDLNRLPNSRGTRIIKTDQGFEAKTVFDDFKTSNDFIKSKIAIEPQKSDSINKVCNVLDSIINDVLEDAYKAFYEIKSYPFIGADRFDMQRFFLYNNESKFMQIMNKFLAFDSVELKNKFNFINKWLKELNIADELIVDYDIDGAGIKIYLLNNGQKTLLSDVGYGINMLIPLIVSLVSYENSYVFIEEPESNLHPSVQSKLALLFLDAYNMYGTRSVIETHSEYLIRKFQVLIADIKINIKAKDVNIYYLYHPEKIPRGNEQIYLMEIRDDGIMKNSFGEGFFDESGNLGVELLNLINLN